MRCKNCKTKFTPIKFLQKYCFKPECIEAWVAVEKPKQWKKEKAKLKADLMTVQDYVKIAQVHFNNYIRERDKGLNCISCDKKALKENAGHFYNANNHWSVRFDEDNVHLQCEHCNTYLHGNLLNYQEAILKRIGYERLEVLSAKSNLTRKYTVQELKEIIKTYKQKYKDLK